MSLSLQLKLNEIYQEGTGIQGARLQAFILAHELHEELERDFREGTRIGPNIPCFVRLKDGLLTFRGVPVFQDSNRKGITEVIGWERQHEYE